MDNICVSVCPAGTYSFYQSDLQFCDSRCPGDRPYIANNQCLQSCPIGQYVTPVDGNPNQFICVTTCSARITAGVLCLPSCLLNQYVSGNFCVDQCPDFHNLATIPPQCTDGCPAMTVRVAGKKLCVGSCEPYGLYPNGGNCVKQCNGALRTLPLGGWECVATCGTAKLDLTRTPNQCISACPSKTYEFNNTCYSSCPGTLVGDQTSTPFRCVAAATVPCTRLATYKGSTYCVASCS